MARPAVRAVTRWQYLYPRAEEADLFLFDVVTTLNSRDSTLVWLDASDPGVEATVRTLEHLPGSRLVVAIRGKDLQERIALNRQVAQFPLGPMRSRAIVDVPSRFTTPGQWIAYLRQLPKTRPLDLYIRFRLHGRDIEVREGDYALSSPWHLYVAKVYALY